MKVYPRIRILTKQVSFWLGKLNFWTNIGTTFFIIFRFLVADPKTKCLSAILGHVASAICSIIGSRLSLLRRIKPYFNFDSSLRSYNSCVNNTLLIVLLPGVTAPPSSVMSQFVFISVLGVCSLNPASLRRLFPYSQNYSGSPFLILLNTGKLCSQMPQR